MTYEQPRAGRGLSIYQTIDDGPISEMSIHQVNLTRARARRVSPAATEGAYEHLRVAKPCTEPLPATFKWIAGLPAGSRPLQLLRRYPRVANTLAAEWTDRRAFLDRLYDLLIDKRGNRRGFPEDVGAELLALRDHVQNSRL